ncbi:MAG: LuxR C-terminal-related transcriptional regulator [Anaerolineales bacterium]
MDTTNLPLQVTRFIGRERELAETETLLGSARLVTLTGPGGCGKTRLALKVAEAARGEFEDGVWLVELDTIREPNLVPQLILQALGLSYQAEQPALESLLQVITSKKMLVVMDNCEHLIDSCARCLQRLLAQPGETRFLATSREPLAVAGERVYPLAGLPLPSENDLRESSLQGLSQNAAVSLFVERARAVLPFFELTPTNAASMVQICRRLDGLPLALELASARCKVLTLQEIEQHLDDRFNLLVSGQRSETGSRHHSLRAAIDWSYALLSPLEQALLRRLSVFAGGCTLKAIEAVCPGTEIGPARTLDLLSSLVDQSLATAQTLRRRETRYHMLETIRQYAREKLDASGEEAAVRDRHLKYYLDLAEQIAPRLNGPDQNEWLEQLAEDYSNLRLALSWSLQSGRIEAGLRIATVLYPFWTVRNYIEEALTWMERLLEQSGEAIPLIVRANAFTNAAYLAGFRGKVEEQIDYAREAERLAEIAGEAGQPARMRAIAVQAFAARLAGDEPTIQAIAKRVVHLFQALGDQPLLAEAAIPFALTVMSSGNYAAAHAILDQGLAQNRAIGDVHGTAMVLNMRGDLARCEQDFAAAQRAYEDSLSLLQDVDAERDTASVLHNLAYTHLHLGDFKRASDLFHRSLQKQQEQQNAEGIAEGLMGFAALAVACGLPAPGVRLFAAARTLGGYPIAPPWPATRLEYEHFLELARSQMSEAEFEAEQAQGQRLSLEEALTYTQDLPLQAAAEQLAGDHAEELTPREREVADLIAQGKSNSEIAAELVLSKRTVETHVSNILTRLNFTSRTQIVRWVLENRLA